MLHREVDVPVWVSQAAVGGLGPLLGPKFTVVGRSWGLWWRCWGALGAYVGGLGPLLGPTLSVLRHSRGPILAVLGGLEA